MFYPCLHGSLLLPSTVQRHVLSEGRLIGNSKLPIGLNAGVNMTANSCLCLCVHPVTDW